MVRPVTSKRKLFNNNKDQFKENEPNQIGSDGQVNASPKNRPVNSNFHSKTKSLSSYKRNSPDIQKDKNGLNSPDSPKQCDNEDAFTCGRTVMPMSERQQIALLMQLSSPSPTNKTEKSSLSSPQTPNTPHFGRGISKRNERGETPLHVAAIKGDFEKVSQLIAQGANVNATDYAGWTALHEACNRGFTVIASLLIKGGADVNAKGLDNDTPLHDACVNNHYQIVKLLLRFGANTDATNFRGKTPFDVCRSPRILLLLEEAKTGKLEFDTQDKEVACLKDFDLASFEVDYTISNNNHSVAFNFSYANSPTKEMSRKTPPNNKTEEKPNVPISVSSSIPTSTSGGISQGGNGTSSGGNGRPVSPRVTLRLPHVPRTPDKSQQRSHDTKTICENEDIYEFRCTKEEAKDGENEEKSEGVKQENLSSDLKGDKRPRENEEDEDEVKKRRRKEDAKEGLKSLGRGAGGRSSSSEKGMKLGQRISSGNGSNTGKQGSSTATSSNSTNSTSTSMSITVSSSSSTSSNTVSSNSSNEQKKSPSGSSVSSPKPSSGNQKTSPEKNDSDNDEMKSENNSGAPKVPPLKIVLAPCGLSEQETSSNNGKNGSNRQLPYVVNSSSEEKESSADSKENVSFKEEPTSISSSIGLSSTVSSISVSSSTSTTVSVSTVGANSSSVSTSNGNSVITSTSSSSDKGSATRITRSQRGVGGGSGSSSGSNSSEDQAPVKTEPKSEDQISTDVVHPRKRKIKLKEPETEQVPPAATPEQPITNCYEMFLKIRKQVERRRKLLFPVQPKPPQGFKDYLMNRCSYVLANSSNSQLSVPIIPAPASLSQPLKDLFNEQEQERYKLRLQQLIEKEKLVLSVEQEILRVHGRAARALANQVLPFSVCTILKDEEVYNVISPEQEEKDRNARSRYNGRLFLSWLQDVDDKWEKIKEAMVLRHHNEAESLHAVQKMDWEWKLKELGLVEPNTKAQIDEMHVPMVKVADFDLLPA